MNINQEKKEFIYKNRKIYVEPEMGRCKPYTGKYYAVSYGNINFQVNECNTPEDAYQRICQLIDFAEENNCPCEGFSIQDESKLRCTNGCPL